MMRRKDREVTDFDRILTIIDSCEILRLGLADGEFPYLVLVNFAYAVEEGELSFYIHGAMAGRKYELMQKNGRCSFELDHPLRMDCIYEVGDVTMRYECVMGMAEISFLEGKEKERVMDEIIMARHEETRTFPYNRKTLDRTAVARLKVLELTAKVNPIAGGAD